MPSAGLQLQLLAWRLTHRLAVSGQTSLSAPLRTYQRHSRDLPVSAYFLSPLAWSQVVRLVAFLEVHGFGVAVLGSSYATHAPIQALGYALQALVLPRQC